MIKFVNFIRLSVLIIALFAGETIFGMMLSNKPRFKKNSPNISLFLLGDDILKNHMMLRLGLKGRLICQKFAQYDTILPKLYAYYWNAERQVIPACAFLDCVNKRQYEKAKWFLDNKQDEPLFYVSGLYNYAVLNPYIIAKNNNDEKMMELLKDYKDYNVYPKIKKIQKSIGHRSAGIKSLSRPTIPTIKLSEADTSILSSFIIDINYPLCLAACMGDIKSFESEIQNCLDNYTLDQVLQSNIPLIMWIAIKNRDLSFISHLLNESSVKKSFNDYMQDKQSNLNLLWFMSLNVPLEWYFHAPRPCNHYMHCITSDKVVLTKKHIDGVEKIIKAGIFTSMSPLLELFKDGNKSIKEIHKILREELECQFVKEVQSLMQRLDLNEQEEELECQLVKEVQSLMQRFDLNEQEAVVIALYKKGYIKENNKLYQQIFCALLKKQSRQKDKDQI